MLSVGRIDSKKIGDTELLIYEGGVVVTRILYISRGKY